MDGELSRIADQAKRMFHGQAWHGPSVQESLVGVDAEIAFDHPIPGAYSIWELILHLASTQAALLRRILGESIAVQDGELLHPAPETPSEEEWAAVLALLGKQEEDLQQAIADFPEERLHAPLTPGGTSAYNNFQGHVQHNAYHVGQIKLLKRLARNRRDNKPGTLPGA